MARHYTMQGVSRAASKAVAWAHMGLTARHPGCTIHDVQLDPRFQMRGVDLLCETLEGGVTGIEVKGDRQAFRGNYFFELISNLEADTPGCFLYSTADWLLYAFLGSGELHFLPLAETRAWFLRQKQDRFRVRHTHTQVGPSRYTTVGALVPTRVAREAISAIEVWELCMGETVGQTVAFRLPSSTRRAKKGSVPRSANARR
jgi:hypothetical protein